jgi:formylglycine-generating enzyme required for sulfatase activity
MKLVSLPKHVSLVLLISMTFYWSNQCECLADEKLPPETALTLKQYSVKVKTEVLLPHEQAVADLKSKFTQALDREQQAAQSKGKLEAALAIKAEKEAAQEEQFDLHGAKPSPFPSVNKMRSTYQLALLRLEETRDSRLLPLMAEVSQTVKVQIDALTKSGKLEEALAAKNALNALIAQPVNTASPKADNGQPNLTFTNSLGMIFVKVPGTTVQMCIHETRNVDYEAYAASQPGVDDLWRGRAVGDKSKCPVVLVRYQEAEGFCRWLSAKENKTYRLPTDEEWSVAVGLGKEIGSTPHEKQEKSKESAFPWGGTYPPSPQDGNFHPFAVDDGYPPPQTAPVMSFKPNKLGVYDLGGNVQEWCLDWYDKDGKERVIRGSADHGALSLRSSTRLHRAPEHQGDGTGFRCVVEGK